MHYTKTIKILRKKPKSLVLPSVADLVFVLALAGVFYVFYSAMMPSLFAVSEIASTELGSAVQSLSIENADTLEELMPRLQSHYAVIMSNMFYMMLSFLVVFIVTQSFSWYKLHILFRKIKFKDYAKQFSLISAVYFTIFVVLAPLMYNFLYFMSRAAGTPVRPVFATMITFIFLVISYLAITTYSLIGEKGIVKKSFKKAFSHYFWKFLVSALSIFIIGFLLSKIITFITSPIIQFLILLLIFPFVTIAKLWLLE